MAGLPAKFARIYEQDRHLLNLLKQQVLSPLEAEMLQHDRAVIDLSTLAAAKDKEERETLIREALTER